MKIDLKEILKQYYPKYLDGYPDSIKNIIYFIIGKLLHLSEINDFLEKHQDRILYGSDFPNVLFPREIEIETLLSLDLSQSFYNKIFRENGAKIMK